jgi:hypothetical protein
MSPATIRRTEVFNFIRIHPAVYNIPNTNKQTKCADKHNTAASGYSFGSSDLIIIIIGQQLYYKCSSIKTFGRCNVIVSDISLICY